MLNVKGGKGGQREHEEAGLGRKHEGLFTKGRCTFPIEVRSWRKSDCWWVEVNMATLTC